MQLLKHEQSAYTMTEEIILHENDILMGRGGKNNQHTGNEKLRILARRRCEEYNAASKKRKTDISHELVRKVREMKPAGRFLKRDQNGDWEDVGDEIAREKASQVLRDAVKERFGPLRGRSSSDIDSAYGSNEDDSTTQPSYTRMSSSSAAAAEETRQDHPPVIDETWRPNSPRAKRSYVGTPPYLPVTPVSCISRKKARYETQYPSDYSYRHPGYTRHTNESARSSSDYAAYHQTSAYSYSSRDYTFSTTDYHQASPRTPSASLHTGFPPSSSHFSYPSHYYPYSSARCDRYYYPSQYCPSPDASWTVESGKSKHFERGQSGSAHTETTHPLEPIQHSFGSSNIELEMTNTSERDGAISPAPYFPFWNDEI